jgi:mannose-1-phosphate guanylyltransferase
MRYTELGVCERNSEETFVHLAGGKTEEIPILPVTPPASRPAGNRWGVILAGGDGVRLRSLTKLISGDDRPKQFCPLWGGKTLLEQTFERSEETIPREQILISLNSLHSRWYSQEAGWRSSHRVVQPMNKGTAPPIVHALLSLAQLDPQAVVAILPCDHYYSDEQSFASTLECAFETASEWTDSVILLGAKPDYPESEYGWIDLGAPLGLDGADLFRVRSFREKPTVDLARTLFEQGSVWNTFVMVGHVRAFLQILQATLPDLVSLLLSASMWKGEETHIQHSVYERTPSLNFSHRVLSAAPDRLMVLRMNEGVWSDVGDPQRALKVAHSTGYESDCLQDWKRDNGWAMNRRDLRGAYPANDSAQSGNS